MVVCYGIHLGVSFASIAKIENGTPIILRSNTLKDRIPMAIHINRRGAIQVGDAAFNVSKAEKLNVLKDWDSCNDNSFMEFTRTMGSDAKYESSNANRSFSSIELSSEVLKTLKSFEKDENINAVVITVPAAFKSNQIEHTRLAGKAAGFEQVEIITEPEAAAWIYGLNTEKKDGYWLVFDFGDGTFDATLLSVNDGIRQVIDTEGDNYLGGKNLDEAIVDEIVIPYFRENYVIENLLSDEYKNSILRTSMKFYAEEIKKQLSFSQETSILTNMGDIPGMDDNGNELELDITVNLLQLEKAMAPLFQRAIDISLNLIKRNKLDRSQLSSLILVGGPTLSPILRKMLNEQICTPDTSVDPMTAVAKGAAIYASTIKRNQDIIEINPSKIQLDINYESASVELEEHVVVKVLPEKTNGEIPAQLLVNISRGDGGWSSGNIPLNAMGEIIGVALESGKSNLFLVSLIDEKGNKLECEPSNFSIIQGSKGGSAVLPYNIGVAVQNFETGKLEFTTIQGLENLQQLPASGSIKRFNTQRAIRPGSISDKFEVSIYNGGYGANGSPIQLNDHVITVSFSGEDLPFYLPLNSELHIKIQININQTIKAFVFIPSQEFLFQCDVQAVEIGRISKNEIEKLLFQLTEDGLISAKAFKEFYEQLSALNGDPDVLEKIHDNIKTFHKG